MKMATSLVDFKEPFNAVHEGSLHDANSKWFVGGKLNACWNAVDRHALSHPDKVSEHDAVVRLRHRELRPNRRDVNVC